MVYQRNMEVWRGNKSYMQYEVDKWDIDEISDISKKNEKKGFAFYTDSNVKWDTNILELFYFTHSTKNITNYKDGVLIINCELEK